MNRRAQTSRFIEAPARSPCLGSCIIVSVLVVLSFSLVTPGTKGASTLVPLVGLLVLAIIGRAIYGVHAALFVLLWLALVSFVPFLQQWPLTTFVPLVAYGAVVRAIPQLRRSVGWMHRGSWSAAVTRLVIATVLVSVLALAGWVVLTKPELKHYLALVPEMPLWAYPFAGIGFAFLNAAMEEAIFRGILMEALDSALGSGYWSVGIQAIPFAALHYLAGFPNGVLGFLMVAVYGVMLGALRRPVKKWP